MWLQSIARLKPGVSLSQAEASLNVLFQQLLAEDTPPSASTQRDNAKDNRLQLQAGGRGASGLRNRFSEPLLVLLGIAGLVLLIACANVANLLLARGVARRKEIGVRLALGASRARLVRQLVTESLLIASIGGALGIVFALWADRLLLTLASRADEAIPLDVSPDARLLLFAFGVTVLTGLIFGVAPALRSTKVDLNPVLKETSRGAIEGARSHFSPGKILVALQVALSLMLLVGAGLFVRSLSNLGSVNLGYDPERLIIFSVEPSTSGYKGPGAMHLYDEILGRIRALPGVRAASLSGNGLFSGSESGDRITVEGYTSKNPRDLNARFDAVAPDYFKTIGIPVLLGREFTAQDAGNAPRVCLINETMAKFYFGSSNPIGKNLTDEFPDTHFTFQIAGVVKDAKYNDVREKDIRRFYVPFFHGMGDEIDARIEVRTFANPTAVTAAIRKEILAVDSSLDLGNFRTMDTLINRSFSEDRLIARLSSFFGVLALLLACIGLYGVMSFAVARRTNEIGIRMALGAQQQGVMWMVVRESMLMAAAGVLIGIPCALAASRLVASRLYGLAAADPLTLIAAPIILLAVALFAALVPALRAARVEPLVALRYE